MGMAKTEVDRMYGFGIAYTTKGGGVDALMVTLRIARTSRRQLRSVSNPSQFPIVAISVSVPKLQVYMYIVSIPISTGFHGENRNSDTDLYPKPRFHRYQHTTEGRTHTQLKSPCMPYSPGLLKTYPSSFPTPCIM